MNKPHLLVIGGTGFVGHHVINEALSRHWNVTSVSLSLPIESDKKKDVAYYQVDIGNLDILRKVLRGSYDYVVNLGGYIDHSLFRDKGRAVMDAHFNGLLNLIQTISRKDLKRFVHVGSSDEYGNAPAPQVETLRESPISPYSLAKVASTHFLQMLYKTENFPATILRLFLTYGPGQGTNRFLPQIISGCLRDDEFPTSGGEQERDFCYVSDTVNAIFLALESNDVNGEIFNVGCGDPITIKSMINKVSDIIGGGHAIFGKIPYRASENMSLYADTTKIREKLGWSPEVDLDDGLRLAINYYKNLNANE